MSKRDELDRLANELANLIEIRDRLSKQITVLQQHRQRLIEANGGRMAANGEYFSRIQVKKYIEIWMDLHMRQYGNSGITQLADGAVVSAATINNILKKEDQHWVKADTVEKLLIYMNMEHVMHEMDLVTGPLWVRGNQHTKAPEPPYRHFEEE